MAHVPARPKTQAQRVLALLERQAIVRPRDLERLGLSRSALYRLCDEGRVQRVGRGLYRLTERDTPTHAGMLEVARRAPKAVVGLLSALAFHGIGTQVPRAVWILIGSKAWSPQLEWPPLEVVRCDPKTLDGDVQVHRIEGVPVRVTSPARTVADCFKHRSRVGLEVAVEALREGWAERRFKLSELRAAARRDRVERVLRPYLEAIT